MTVVTDLATANDDGTWSIDFTADDDSDYVLFAFYQYGTSESYAAACTGQGYTINYFDPAGANALISYWDENVLTDDVMAMLDEIDEADLYMDSLELMTKEENSTKQLWCQDMLTQFKNRRGYDLEKYLPLLIRETPDTLSGMGQYLTYVYDFTDTDEINMDYLRNDFFQTETELYQENCLDLLHSWLNAKGMNLRAENCYGKTFEMTQTVSSVDYLETESFEFAADVDSYRNFSGAAHVYDKRLSSESGASIFTNYLWNNGYYRQIFYTQYAAGIQKTVTHGYSCAYGLEESVAWPGYEGMTNFISERFNKRQPGFIDYVDANTHLSRIQEALEEGVPQVDIAMIRTDYNLNNLLTNVSSSGVYNNALHNDRAYYWTDLGLQDNGYTYDYFSSYTFMDDEVNVSDGMINSDGVAYKAVIVMEDELPLAAAEKLKEAAENGLPVLFVNNVSEHPNNSGIDKVNTIAVSTTGCNDGQDTELAAVIEEIKALDNVMTVDSYTPGEKLERTETNEETGVTTTEVTIDTAHETIDCGALDALVSWKDIEALGDTISGVGTYTAEFTVPDDFDPATMTAAFKADSFNYGTAMITVNGEKVSVNMDTAEADITDAVKPGENTITVRVTSSLCNVARTYDSIFWITADTEPADYGMTGTTTLIVTAEE